MAPELYNEQPYSFEADIWSLGIILYELCALDYPFHSSDGSQMMLAKEVVKGNYKDIPDVYSEELRVLLKHLLNIDGSKRPNINQICAFPLIKDKIVEVMSMASIQEEFAHTVMHNRDVFAELKAKKKGKKEGHEEKKGMLDD